MNPELLAMLGALFPDSVDVRQCNDNTVRTYSPIFPTTRYRADEDPAVVKIEVEEINLEPITEGQPMVYAAMSQKSRCVFYRVEE